MNGSDGLFLAAVTLVSLVLYVWRLGFYADDWAFLGILSNASDQSFVGLWRTLYQAQPLLQARPTQITEQVLLYSLFGVDPLGYHLVHAGVLTAMAVLLYAALVELGVWRVVAVALPAVFVLLPNYSTDRVWFAAFGYALTMALLFLSVYADLRAARAAGKRLLAWKMLALVALVLSVLGYEVVVPFLLLAPLLVWLRARRGATGGLRMRLGTARFVLFLAANYAALATVVAFKAVTARGAGVPVGYWQWYLAQLFFGSLSVHFGTYGVGLPHTVWWSLRVLDSPAIATGLVVGAAVFAYLFFLSGGWDALSRRTWAKMGVVGFVLFTLGYAIFLASNRIQFGSSTGIVNRVAIAASLGVAVLFVAVAGWLSSFARKARLRRAVFAGSVAFVCCSGFLVTNALASFWGPAWDREREVLAGIRAELPRISPGSTLIVHGICPYIGPAVVFESPWDLAGALQVAYRDPSLAGDVTTANIVVGRAGLTTTIYGRSTTYPYSERLLLFDRVRGRVISLSNEQVARQYFATLPRNEFRGCPGEAGEGALVFPFDRLYAKLEQRGFRPF